MDKKFYTYELVVSISGKVCYVGKGQGTRISAHHRRVAVLLRRRKRGVKISCGPLYRQLLNLVDGGDQFLSRKVFETDSEAEALAEETRRILLYGIDTLFNIKRYDSERPGDIISRAVHRHVSDCVKRFGIGCTPETRAKVVAGVIAYNKEKQELYGAGASPATRLKLALVTTNNWKSIIEQKDRLAVQVTNKPFLKSVLSLKTLVELDKCGKLPEAKYIADSNSQRQACRLINALVGHTNRVYPRYVQMADKKKILCAKIKASSNLAKMVSTKNLLVLEENGKLAAARSIAASNLPCVAAVLIRQLATVSSFKAQPTTV